MSERFDADHFVAGFIAETEEHLGAANAALLLVEGAAAKGQSTPRQVRFSRLIRRSVVMTMVRVVGPAAPPALARGATPASQPARPGTRTGRPAASQTVTASTGARRLPGGAALGMTQSARAGGMAPPAVNCA